MAYLTKASPDERERLAAKLRQFAEDTKFEEVLLVQEEFSRQFGGNRIKGGPPSLWFSYDAGTRATAMSFSNPYFGEVSVEVTNRAAPAAA